MEKKNYTSQIQEQERKILSPLALKEELNSLSRDELSVRISSLQREERIKVWSILDRKRILEVLEDNGNPIEWFSEMSLKAQSRLIDEMDQEKAELILRSLPVEKRKAILSLAEREMGARLRYEEDEIGSIMSDDFIILSKDITAGEALERVRESAEGKENIRTIFLEGGGSGLYGEVDLLDILRARKDEHILSVATTSFPFVPAEAKIDKSIETIRGYNLSSFPVIDEEGKVIGAVTSRTLMATLEKTMEEDYRKLASLKDEDSGEKSIRAAMFSRLPWLFLLLVLGLLVSFLIGTLSSMAIGLTLVFSFQSLILDMTGNGATQTLAVAVRSISGSELSGKEKLSLVKKEVSTGILLGLILGAASALVLLPYILIRSGNGIVYAATLSLSIASSLLVAMTLSNGIGVLIPLGAEKLGIDPAVASGPLITTFNDLIGATSYYLAVFFLLRKLLGF